MSVEKKTAGFFPVPQLQADAIKTQASPASGTKYTVLDTTKNVRVISIAAQCTWTVQPDPLEVHLTIDGQAITHAFANPVSATTYDAYVEAGRIATDQQLTLVGVEHYARGVLYEGRSVKVEAEITGGTVQQLVCWVKYAKW